MIPRVVATVDLAALQHNFKHIQQLLGHDVKVMPMVKANAYGHGLIDVTRALPEAHAFGVATINEARRLREAGISQQIFVMCGFRHPDELDEFSALHLTAVIHHPDQVTWLEASTVTHQFPIWMKVDTGMHRLGFDLNQFEAQLNRLMRCHHIQQPVGVMTHLASADSDPAFTEAQLDAFHQLVDKHQLAMSVRNSAGVLTVRQGHYQLARPGIILYGVSPLSNQDGPSLDLKPVMTLTSFIVSYRQVNAGESVGYGRTWRAPVSMPVGILTVGYGDGYPRHACSGTPVLIHGQRCPIVGRISMDMLAVDLRPVQGDVSIGDEALLWGPGLPVEEIAQCADTIPYEILCQLTDRVTRCIKGDRRSVC